MNKIFITLNESKKIKIIDDIQKKNLLFYLKKIKSF